MHEYDIHYNNIIIILNLISKSASKVQARAHTRVECKVDKIKKWSQEEVVKNNLEELRSACEATPSVSNHLETSRRTIVLIIMDTYSMINLINLLFLSVLCVGVAS